MRANFPYIHLLLCWLLSSSRTFYDSVMCIGLFPADFLLGTSFWSLHFFKKLLISVKPIVKKICRLFLIHCHYFLNFLVRVKLLLFQCSSAVWTALENGSGDGHIPVDVYP